MTAKAWLVAPLALVAAPAAAVLPDGMVSLATFGPPGPARYLENSFGRVDGQTVDGSETALVSPDSHGTVFAQVAGAAEPHYAYAMLFQTFRIDGDASVSGPTVLASIVADAEVGAGGSGYGRAQLGLYRAGQSPELLISSSPIVLICPAVRSGASRGRKPSTSTFPMNSRSASNTASINMPTHM